MGGGTPHHVMFRSGLMKIKFIQNIRKPLCMDMTVITQLYGQLYIKCQPHATANTIFGHHQVGYNYRRKLHSI